MPVETVQVQLIHRLCNIDFAPAKPSPTAIGNVDKNVIEWRGLTFLNRHLKKIHCHSIGKMRIIQLRKRRKHRDYLVGHMGSTEGIKHVFSCNFVY